MSEFDNVLNGTADKKAEQTVPEAQFDDALEGGGDKKTYGQMMAEKKAKCYAMIDDACLAVMSSPEKLYEYLMVQSSFERYSLNNNLLIFAQNPGATKLKDFEGWKKAGCYVKKGAESIMILEPSNYTGTDGKPHRGYNAKNVFNIEDVNVPPEAHSEEKTYEQKKLVEALVHDSPVPIRKAEQNLGDNFAVYDPQNKTIYFKPGLEFAEVFPAIAKALAHAEMAKGDVNYRVNDNEFKARCSANIIAQKYGVDIHTVDIHVIPPKYASLEAEDVKKELGAVHDNVKTITTRMTEVLEKTQEKEQSQPHAQTQNKGSKNREER